MEQFLSTNFNIWGGGVNIFVLNSLIYAEN